MFVLLDLAPGDHLRLYVNIESLSANEIAEARHELGLDRSLPVRYGAWLLRLAQGDLGRSLRRERSVG